MGKTEEALFNPKCSFGVIRCVVSEVESEGAVNPGALCPNGHRERPSRRSEHALSLLTPFLSGAHRRRVLITAVSFRAFKTRLNSRQD